MLLTDFADKIDVLRDGAFSSTGPIDTAVAGPVLAFALKEPYLARALGNHRIKAVLVPAALAQIAMQSDCAVAVAADPRRAFFVIHNATELQQMGHDHGPDIAADARIAPGVHIPDGVKIGAGVCIETGAIIGRDVSIEEGAYIGHGAVIGASGHFEQWNGSQRMRIAHMGSVRVGRYAQVLAGAIVQRDVYAVETSINDNAVIGPGVKISHGVNIGAGSVITGGCTIAGYTKIGSDVWVGPGSVIGNNLIIADRARVEIGSVVVKSVAEDQRVSGSFALDHRMAMRHWIKLSNGGM